jgi:hypothetical protein
MTVTGVTECCERTVGKAGSGRMYVCAIPGGVVATMTAVVAVALEAAAGKGQAWDGDQQMKRPAATSMRASQYNRVETNEQGQTGTSKKRRRQHERVAASTNEGR